MDNDNKEAKNLFTLSLPDVASWQVDGIESPLSAALPALQRGAVWKPAQTERLWDSLIRGFPIGSFLLSEYDADHYGKASMKLGTCENPQFHLLDGQQRATAIALGFYDVWQSEFVSQRLDGPVLWVDLAPPPEKDDRDFIFRVMTRSHPWGYRRKNPEERLASKAMAHAIKAYKTASPQLDGEKTSNIPLSHVWPWDAEAPLPVSLILNAIKPGGDVIANLRNELSRLPYWDSQLALLENGDGLRAKIESIFDDKDSILHQRLHLIINLLKRLCAKDSGIITAQVLPKIDNSISTDDRIDPVETLFVRINSSGTKLEGEELMYSLLKSAWRDAPQAITKLQDGQQWVSPARLALLITRLNLVHEDIKTVAEKRTLVTSPPPMPDVARFRRIMHESGRIDEMKRFVEGDLSSLWKTANELVMMSNKSPLTNEYRLPPTLAADMASGLAGNELLLLLTTWLMRLHHAGISLNDIKPKTRQRTLGFFVAMSWFALDVKKCVQRLWPTLMKLNPQDLPKFFNRTRFRTLLPADVKSGLIMLPLIKPDDLEKLIDLRITGGSNGYLGINNPETNIWDDRKEWEHFNNRLSSWESGVSGFNKLPKHMRDWLAQQDLEPIALPNNENQQHDRARLAELKDDEVERRRLAWRLFLDRLWTMRKMVDYAQRDYLIRWFPDFDPTQPGQMEDINRPWDYDHIHAANLIAGKWNIPGVIRKWHHSIGNLRSWPLELNRADQDCPPIDKLGDQIDIDTIINSYGLTNTAELRCASFIDENDDWPYWQHSVPQNVSGNYLADTQYAAFRINLIKAICSRFGRLYRTWYEELAIGSFAEP